MKLLREIISFVKSGKQQAINQQEAFEREHKEIKQRIADGKKQMNEWKPRLLK